MKAARTRFSSRIALLLVVAGAGLLDPVATHAQPAKLYWAASDGVWRANLDGTGVERLVEGQIEALALDAAAGKLYWGTSDGLSRAGLDGRNVEEVPIPPGGAFSLAVDPRAQKIYWVGRVDEGEGSSNTLHRADRNGANREVVLSLPRIAGLALDPRAETLYAATHDQGFGQLPVSWAIVRIDTGSLDVETVLESGGITQTFFLAINRLALDRLHGRIYWSEGGHGATRDGRMQRRVVRANLDGSDIVQVLPRINIGFIGYVRIPSIALDPGAARLYWTDFNGIARIDPNQNFTGIFEQILFIDGIQVTDIALFTTPGDFDRDGDVDLADVVTFQGCFSGSGTPLPGATICYEADLDWDGDVDLADLLTFQAHFTGSK